MRPGSDVISGLVADDVMSLVGVAAVPASVGACTNQLEVVDHSGRTTDEARPLGPARRLVQPYGRRGCPSARTCFSSTT